MSSLPVLAETSGTLSVTIHKQAVPTQAMDPRQNTGETMDFAGEPLADVEFKAFDVTDDYYKLLEHQTAKQAVASLQETYTDKWPKLVALDSQLTQANGQAQFATLPMDQGGRDAVYVFVETKEAPKYRLAKQAQPIVLTLPIYRMNEDGSFSSEKLSEVHLYPKNVGVPVRPVEPGPKPEPKPTTTPIQKPSFQLPQTGEIKSMLSLLGIVMVSGVWLLWKKQKNVNKKIK